MKYRLFAMALALSLTTGCFHNEIVVQRNALAKVETNVAPDYENGWQMYMFWTLLPLGNNPIDIQKVCPENGVGYIEVEAGLLNSAVTILTVGILNFQSVRIWCA